MATEEPRDIAREAARLAREAARAARDEARSEARRIRAEATKIHREARRHGPQAFGFDSLSDGASVHGALDVDGVRVVLVKQTAGRLTIRPCADGETPGVEASASKSPPDLSVTRDGDRMVVDVRLSLGRLFRRRKGADTIVRLGPGFSSLQVDMAHGHLMLGDVRCDDISIDVGAGDVSLRRVAANATIDVGAGQIVVKDHTGLVACDCGTGDVRIDIAEARSGAYSIEVGIGQAELTLPAGLKVHPSISSGLGKGETNYPDAGEDADIRVTLNTGIGRAAISARTRESAASTPATGKRKAGPSRQTESEEVRVLQLLEQGRITAQEAADLIAALQGNPRPSDDNSFD